MFAINADLFSLSSENAHLFDDLKRSYFETIRAIINSIEARDPYTKGHSHRVAQLAKTIAEELDWSQEDKDLIDWGAVLHDVGKIGIPDAVLNKPDMLTDEEYQVIKSHPLIGAEIVKGISLLEPLTPYILEHHERFDGSGYPKGLAGDSISVKARLLAVADTFDAMTTDRPYQKGLGPEAAFNKVLAKAGTQFDPEIVKAFERSWRSGNKMHHKECCSRRRQKQLLSSHVTQYSLLPRQPCTCHKKGCQRASVLEVRSLNIPPQGQ